MTKKQMAELELLSPPGDTILETIEHREMSLDDLAHAMGWPRYRINGLINGAEAITEDIALQLENVLRIDASFWMNRERLYRQKLASIYKRDPTG